MQNCRVQNLSEFGEKLKKKSHDNSKCEWNFFFKPESLYVHNYIYSTVHSKALTALTYF